MQKQRVIAALMAIIILMAFSSCKKDGQDNTSPTFSDGSVEDVFNINGEIKEGEEPTIDSALIDGDSGKVTTGKNTTKAATEQHNVKEETTVSGAVSAAATEEGYKLSWKAVSGATGYNIYRATSKDGEYAFLATTTNTYYLDKSGSNKYSYKITIVTQTATTTQQVTIKNSSNFVGYSNIDSGTPFDTNNTNIPAKVYMSTKLNNSYIAYIRNEYAKMGVKCIPGYFAYVQLVDCDTYTNYLYVFQFDNTKTWNATTLDQVHIFTDKNDMSKYFSFFTKNTGSQEYLAAKSNAEKNWDKIQKSHSSNPTPYVDQQAVFLILADLPEFQQFITASYQ